MIVWREQHFAALSVDCNRIIFKHDYYERDLRWTQAYIDGGARPKRRLIELL